MKYTGKDALKRWASARALRKKFDDLFKGTSYHLPNSKKSVLFLSPKACYSLERTLYAYRHI